MTVSVAAASVTFSVCPVEKIRRVVAPTLRARAVPRPGSAAAPRMGGTRPSSWLIAGELQLRRERSAAGASG